jgi:hypothetical protein
MGSIAFSIAQELLDLPEMSHWQGIVFYDEHDKQMILERGSKEPIALSNSNILIDKRFTFYDQKHTRGADIAQSSSARALVTFNHQTVLRDLLQGVWRFRGLDKAQKVEFVVDSEIKASIFAMLKEFTEEEFSGDLTLDHIFLFTTFNQAHEQGDNNFRALKHKMKALLQAESFGSALDLPVTIDEFIKLLQMSRPLFIKRTDQSAWELYGSIKKMTASKEVINQLSNQLLTSETAQALSNHPELSKLPGIAQFPEKIHFLVEKILDTLPSQLVTAEGNYADVDYDQEVELEVENEAETQTETETEVENENELALELGNLNVRFHIKIFNSRRAVDKKFDRRIYHAKTRQEIDEAVTFQDKMREYSLPIEHVYNYEISQNAIFTSPQMTMKETSNFKKYQEIFDPDLLSTINLQPSYDSLGYFPSYCPFDRFQKVVSKILIVEDQGEIKLLMLAKFFQNLRAIKHKARQLPSAPPIGK